MGTDYADPDPRFALCPRCQRPLRLDTRCEGLPLYRCSNNRCLFESTRDGVVEALVFELHKTNQLFEQLARIALPMMVRRLVQPGGWAGEPDSADPETAQALTPTGGT